MSVGRICVREVDLADADETVVQAARLVGLVSLDDVLMLLAEEFTQVGRLLQRETPTGAMQEA